MARKMRVTLWTLGIVTVVIAAFMLIFDWNMMRGFVERKVYEKTGRELSIAGDLDVDLGLVPEIRLENVQFANAPWGSEPAMVDAKAITFSVRLMDLLRGEMTFSEVALIQTTIALEINQQGQRNWDLKKLKEPKGKGEQSPGPVVQHLVIDDGRVIYRDAKSGTDVTVDVANTGQASDMPLELAAAGQFKHMPLQGQARGGGILRLRNLHEPYPLDMSLRIGTTSATLVGTVTNLAGFDAMNVQLDLKGDSLAGLHSIVGVSLPDSPPYSLKSKLNHDAAEWRLTNIEGKVGDSDIAGELSVDTGNGPPRITADVVSRRLDLDDLAGFIGAPPSSKPGETASPEQEQRAKAEAADPKAIPDKPLKFDRLHTFDADVSFRAQQIQREGLPLDDLNVHLRLDKGHLRLDPLNFGVAEGNVVSKVDIKALQPAQLQAQVELRKLNLGKLFPKLEAGKQNVGLIGGRGELTGQGNSLGEVLASADGALGLAMSGGTVSNLLLEVLGIDAAEIVKFLLGGDETVPLRCAVAQFQVEKGVVRTERFVIDTEDTNIYADGEINLASESLGLTLTPKPKDVSIFSGRTPLDVKGTFKKPEFEPHAGPIAARVGAAAVGAMVNPVLALVPFIETGPGENQNCADLIKEAQEFGVPPDTH